jgi:hypothetical protein
MDKAYIETVAESILDESVEHDDAYKLFEEELETTEDKKALVSGMVRFGYDHLVPDYLLDKFGLYDQVYGAYEEKDGM